MTRTKTRTKRRRCRAVGQRGKDGRLHIWPSWTDTQLDAQSRITLEDGRKFALEPCDRAVNHSSWLYPNFCRDCRDAWLENDYREKKCKAVGTVDANSVFHPIFELRLLDMDDDGVILSQRRPSMGFRERHLPMHGGTGTARRRARLDRDRKVLRTSAR